MARPIASTPRLDARASRKFITRMERDINKPMRPVPTPKVDKAIQDLMADATKSKK